MPKKKVSEDTTIEPAIARLSDKKAESFLPFGIPELDELTGGIPRGRITELWGQEMVGKTYTLGMIMAGNKGKKILIIDAEFALEKERLKQFGADLENIDFIQDARLERVSELVLGSIGKYDLILVDSLAFLTPTTVENAAVGENAIGLFSRLVKHWVVKLRPRLGTSETALVVVNQYRVPFGLYARSEPVGGKAWLHAVDVRLFMSTNSADKVTKEGARTGHWVHVEVKKSKVSAPGLQTKFLLGY